MKCFGGRMKNKKRNIFNSASNNDNSDDYSSIVNYSNIE